MVLIHKLPIKDAYIVKSKIDEDNRGFLREFYNHDVYPEEIRKFFTVKQITLAANVPNALRGLVTVHFAKLLSCASGAIYDVVVDLRKSSPTDLNWSAVLLTSKNGKQLLVPPGCAHGYYAVEDGSMAVYCQGGTYSSVISETRIYPLDETLNIYWPIPKGTEPIISEKDKNNPRLEKDNRIVEKRKRVLVIGASSSAGFKIMEHLKESHFSLQVYGAAEKPLTEGVMDFNLDQAADDIAYLEEVLTVCRPHILIICLPWGPKIQDVVKGFCKINNEFKMKIVLCCDATWFAQEAKNVEKVEDLILEEFGGALLKDISTTNGNGLKTEDVATILQNDLRGTYFLTWPKTVNKTDMKEITSRNGLIVSNANITAE